MIEVIRLSSPNHSHTAKKPKDEGKLEIIPFCHKELQGKYLHCHISPEQKEEKYSLENT